MMKRFLTLMLTASAMTICLAARPEFPGVRSDYNGHERYDFRLEDREAIVILPDEPLEGNPWVWRPAFFGAFPNIDEALLKAGFVMAYYDNTYEWGRPEAMDSGEKFYRLMTDSCHLHPKPVMNGLSRGGYYSLRRAELYPETVGCMILDNPLVDIFELKRDDEWWSDVQAKWHTEEAPIERGSFKENAAYNINIPASHHIPVLLLSGGSDTIVPYEANGRIVKETYERYGAPIKSIVRPGMNHHPHALDNGRQDSIVPYVKKAVYGQLDEKHPLKVACIGNSITWGVGTTDHNTKSYPAVLQSILGDGYEIGNFGVSSSTALRKGTDAGQPFAWLDTQACKEAVAFNPDIVVIKLGGNDSKPANWQYAEDFEKDYQEIIDTFKYLPSLPKIYLCLPVAIRTDDPAQCWGIDERVIVEEITPRIIRIAHANRLPTIDLHHVYEGEEAICYSDHVHPTDRGAELIAKQIAGSIINKQPKNILQ